MNSPANSVSARLRKEPVPCPECGSTSRVGRGFCLVCLLYSGLRADTDNTETLEKVLDEIDVRGADWRLGNYQILEEIGRAGNMPALPLNSDRRPGRIYLAYRRFCGVNNVA